MNPIAHLTGAEPAPSFEEVNWRDPASINAHLQARLGRVLETDTAFGYPGLLDDLTYVFEISQGSRVDASEALKSFFFEEREQEQRVALLKAMLLLEQLEMLSVQTAMNAFYGTHEGQQAYLERIAPVHRHDHYGFGASWQKSILHPDTGTV